jgi:hypothetical protein
MLCSAAFLMARECKPTIRVRIEHTLYPAVQAQLVRMASLCERAVRTDMDTIAPDCGQMTTP